LLVTACDASPRAAGWTFVFATPELDARAELIEARILEGGCEGTEIYSGLIGDGMETPRPGVITPGVVGLAGRARDIDCVWFAAGCTPVTLPQLEGATTTVVLEASAESPECAGACVSGTCPQLDAGPTDAGGDTVITDTFVPVDVPQPDGGCTAASHPDSCAGDVLTQCVGSALVGSACALGCNAAGDACGVFVPSNLATVTFTEGLADVSVGASTPDVWIFDTDTGAIDAYDAPDLSGSATAIRAAGEGVEAGIGFDIDLQIDEAAGVPRLGIFSMDDLDVPTDATIIGVGSLPLVLLANRNAIIHGTIAVGADVISGASAPGPGGGAGGGRALDGAGPGGGERGIDPSSGPDNGGGGGSFGGSGGDGGLNEGTAGSSAGSTYGNETLTPLRGGSGGGGGTETTHGGMGGHGGGAIQISAGGRLDVESSGRIDANGSGGRGGIVVSSSGGGGGGAGSGGGVLLEAPDVIIDGRVGANGGAGGQGTQTPTTGGAFGRRGSTEMAPIMATTSADYGDGGDGSDANGVGSDGDPISTSNNAGGGGGGGGRVRVNNLSGSGRGAYSSRVLPSSSALFTVGSITIR